jgi:hypothetical protein
MRWMSYVFAILAMCVLLATRPLPAQAGEWGVLMKPSAPLRKTQGLSGAVVGVLRQGDQVEVLGRNDGWARIFAPALGERGFVKENDLRESTERIKPLRTGLEMLACPDKGCAALLHLPKGAAIEILEYTYPGGATKWARIWAYDQGVEGWAPADKVIR